MREFHVKSYGAVGDGITMNTAAIQSAIDDCAAQGGGRVVVGEGTYLSGSITLRSRVELHIEADGCLLGSADWGRNVNAPILTHTKNVVFHNTAFSAD